MTLINTCNTNGGPGPQLIWPCQINLSSHFLSVHISLSNLLVGALQKEKPREDKSSFKMEDQEDSFNKHYFDMKVFVFCALVGIFLLKIMVMFWWKPRKIEQHFSKQGIKGPSYKFLIGNAKEIMSLMMKASAKPMPFPFSHNILPRVLSFYHHWKKIYGMFHVYLSFSLYYFTSSLFFRI